ncbi:FkbM family methyltransferase [Epilithonimonas hispanica]|uniref:Methyltransferase FkbM domain-containing protein n=1 Tax=Epilithonimonas hispanica TaxID=358687 RepID=A0A3D9D1M9_9FLAO|nr:FkbM family methyltransferase [Epilithonimonas hispanica]REC71915.1 hypothetical protein DRF58_04580 [Epilithonimonas hispanica]
MLLSLPYLKKMYPNFPTKILHLGAHLAEEAEEYSANDITDVIWVEGNSKLVDGLKTKLQNYPINSQIYNIMISEKDKEEIIFNITDFDQSSSILEPALTQKLHKTKIVETQKIVGRRLDSYFLENSIVLNDYRLMVIDLQGYELYAIKSLGKLLNNFDFIMAEINLKELYKNCTLLRDLDVFLANHGFVRKETFVNENFWGDALYVRTNITGFSFVSNILNKFNIQYYNFISSRKHFHRALKSFAYTIYYKIKS